ncbi:MAG: thioredoxin family protein [Candidatus Bathyarchaeia archaeon]
MIREDHRRRLTEEFKKKLEKPIRLIVFTQEVECPFCAQTRSLIEELGSLSDKITVEVYDFIKDSKKAEEYAVDKVPAVAIVGEKDYGLRFYGLPYGYEFQTLLEALSYVSTGRTNLSEESKRKLKTLKTTVHIQVFVTLTCPYCPSVASLAYRCAVESDMVKAEVVDVSEFPHLAYKYAVMGVPKTIINDKVEFVGAVPEKLFIDYIMLAIGSPGYIL